jgi:hypothetical protein
MLAPSKRRYIKDSSEKKLKGASQWLKNKWHHKQWSCFIKRAVVLEKANMNLAGQWTARQSTHPHFRLHLLSEIQAAPFFFSVLMWRTDAAIKAGHDSGFMSFLFYSHAPAAVFGASRKVHIKRGTTVLKVQGTVARKYTAGANLAFIGSI